MGSGFKALYGTNSSEMCGSIHPWFPALKCREADNLAGTVLPLTWAGTWYPDKTTSSSKNLTLAVVLGVSLQNNKNKKAELFSFLLTLFKARSFLGEKTGRIFGILRYCGKRIRQGKSLLFAKNMYLFLERKKYVASTLLLKPLNPDYIKQEKCNSTIYLLFIVLPHGLLKTRLKIT